MELESAVERLYTDESLAGDVDDATAKPLLKWAELQLPAIISRFGDAGFDDAFITLKKLVKSVARLIDGRGEMDESERAERMEKIQAFAQEIGVTVDTALTGDLAAQSGPAIVAQVLPVQAAQVAEPAQETPMPPQAELGTETVSSVPPAGTDAIETPEAAASYPIGGAPTQQADLPPEAEIAETSGEILPDSPTAAPETVDSEAPQPTAEPAPQTDEPESTAPKSGLQSFFQRVADALKPSGQSANDDIKE